MSTQKPFSIAEDILPLKNLQRHLDPKATFATVIAEGGVSYFQAFLAASPKHPIILESLKEFKAWYDLLNKPGQNKASRFRSTDGSGAKSDSYIVHCILYVHNIHI